MVMGELAQETEVLVIGGGPGGYAAAFRAADLGLDVTMVDTAPRPGGVCLFRGCIPSKTLLHLTELINDARNAENLGVTFAAPRIDLDAVGKWKGKVIDRLASGLESLSEKRGVQRIQGRAVFEASNRARVYDSEVSRIKFRYAILATGSHATPLPGTDFSAGSRIMSSAGALALTDIPQSLLVIGGGYVGLELGSVYASLGSQVTMVELGDRLLPGVDSDLLDPLNRKLQEIFKTIHLNTRVVGLKEYEDRVDVTLQGQTDITEQSFDRALIAIGLENTKIEINNQGFVIVDDQQRTADERIFAVGDVAGGLLLAHKATREGKVAAEVIAGKPSAFDVRAIPAVVFTDPQIAWCGLTETEARERNIAVSVHRFPWKFSGRAVTMDAVAGLTKIIIDPETERILGMGITGRNAEAMISEGVLAVEMGALASDVALTMHPHPTLSETEGEAAEIFLGSATHILSRKQ
ncbi:dihydrolipoyl dehydrogenase [Thermodesulfobacteriota bacterium]